MICFMLLVLMMAPIPGDAFAAAALSSLKWAYDWSYEMYSKLAEAYDLYGTATSTTSLDTIMNQLSEVANQINDLGSRLEQKIDAVVQTLIRRLPLIAEVKSGMKKISETIVRVDGWYSKFEFYMQNNDTKGSTVLKEFASSILSHSAGGLEDMLNSIFRLLIPGRSGAITESLLVSIKKATDESRKELCDTGVSPQQRLYQLYSAIVITEMRAYAMMSFSYSYLSSLRNESSKSSLKRIKTNFDDRIKNYMETIKSVTENLPRDIRACDPPVHELGRTCYEFEGLLATFIANEVDLNSERTCKNSCESQPKPTRTYGDYNSGIWRRAFECHGDIFDCKYGGGSMSICQLPNWDLIRYDWYKVNDGTVYGQENSCPNGWMQYPYGWTSVPNRCDYCVCTCADNERHSKAKYAVSLLDQVSNIKNNMVVTGVRFVQKDRILHIQIEEGKLGPAGTIETGTDRWVPYGKFEINKDHHADSGSDKYAGFNRIKDTTNGVTKEALPSYKFMILRSDRRTLYLDDIYVPRDYVITGVRFDSKYNDEFKGIGLPLLLMVQMTPFDYANGKLILEGGKKSKWIDFNDRDSRSSPEIYQFRRTEMILKEPNAPMKSMLNMPDSIPNSYIKFRPSDERKDAGKRTVPFWDALPVTGKTKFPLQGIGIFHKGYEGYGGFISLKIMGIDVSTLFNTTV